MIKRFNIIFILFTFLSIGLISCNNTSKPVYPKTYEQVEAEFRASLTKSDTLCVLQMADSIMKELQGGELDLALSKLYLLTTEGLVPVDNKKIAKLKKHFSSFPVVDYKLIYYNFSTAYLNDLKYSIQFLKTESNEQVPSISFMFNPCKIKGKWYLCVKDEGQSSKDLKNQIHPQTPVYDK